MKVSDTPTTKTGRLAIWLLLKLNGARMWLGDKWRKVKGDK